MLYNFLLIVCMWCFKMFDKYGRQTRHHLISFVTSPTGSVNVSCYNKEAFVCISYYWWWYCYWWIWKIASSKKSNILSIGKLYLVYVGLYKEQEPSLFKLRLTLFTLSSHIHFFVYDEFCLCCDSVCYHWAHIEISEWGVVRGGKWWDLLGDSMRSIKHVVYMYNSVYVCEK